MQVRIRLYRVFALTIFTSTAVLAKAPGYTASGLTKERTRESARVNLTRPTGLVTRSWFRGLIFAADEDNGYSTMTFPSVNEAIRRNDQTLTTSEVADPASRFNAATRQLERAPSLLSGN